MYMYVFICVYISTKYATILYPQNNTLPCSGKAPIIHHQTLNRYHEVAAPAACQSKLHSYKGLCKDTDRLAWSQAPVGKTRWADAGASTEV